MANPERIARMRAYLEQHRDTYTQDALQRQLLADGHDQAEIDQAMAHVYGFEASADASAPLPTPTASDQTQVVLIAIGVVLLNILLPCGIFSAASSLNNENVFWTLSALALLLPVVIEGGTAFAQRTRNPTLSRGLKWGVIAWLVLLALGALLFGVCIALLSGTL